MKLFCMLTTCRNSPASSPCANPNLGGQALYGKYTPDGGTTFQPVKGMLLCLKNFGTRPATLTLGFTPDGGNRPDPDQVNSAAGTVVHEMIHVLDRTTYTDQEDKWGVVCYGFQRCAALATDVQDAAAVNPDNYSIFAEMCMSPKTRWALPSPVGMPALAAAPSTVGNPFGERSISFDVFERRDRPRRTMADRRMSPNFKALAVVQMSHAGELGRAAS
jgi:hypothetical protein